MIKSKAVALIRILPLLFSIAILGCGGSGGDSNQPPAPTSSLGVLPSSFYDFGIVTPGNAAAPLEVKITNHGTANLDVSSISLLDTNNFSMDLTGGSSPCNSTAPTIATGGYCTVVVAFVPQSTALFNTNFTINSNDPVKPTVILSLRGSQEEISSLSVRINQVEISCPSRVVTAYVSVMDQGGYPVNGLTRDDFSVRESSGYTGTPVNSSFVDNNASISAALVLDYSTSITPFPDKLSDMQESAVSFVNQLGAQDEAEIIKFGPIAEVVQSYTSDKGLLTDAINAPWNEGGGTALYDACKTAVDTTASRSKDRKAVIAISDGDEHSSSIGIDELIDDAVLYNIPIFAVGLGDAINVSILKTLADNTSGQYYEASTSDNLKTVFQQLADVLFHDQYIITYTSGLAAGSTANLTVEANLNGIKGDDTTNITQCP